MRHHDVGVLTIRVSELTGASIPREQEWGASASIMEAQVTRGEAGARLQILLQSGDSLTLVGRDVSIRV